LSVTEPRDAAACTCGDGVVDPGEQCDNGANNSVTDYNGCTPGCTRGPYCGDGIWQSQFEECDDGVFAAQYDGCAPGCVLGPHCGDGIIQSPPEECDDGNNINGDGCRRNCQVQL
jgi:cysteine-rich repeat protein